MNFSYQNITLGDRVSSVVSCFLGIGLLAWCVTDFYKITSQGGSQLAIFGRSLLAFAQGIAGIILLAPTLTRWFMTPAFRMVDLIYCPGGYAKRPPLDYRLADYYRTTRQFDLAIERYETIVYYYPQEAAAHAWLCVIVDRIQKGKLRSRRVFGRARRSLRKRESWKEFRAIAKQGKAEWS